jgi:hypothetical protein
MYNKSVGGYKPINIIYCGFIVNLIRTTTFMSIYMQFGTYSDY